MRLASNGPRGVPHGLVSNPSDREPGRWLRANGETRLKHDGTGSLHLDAGQCSSSNLGLANRLCLSQASQCKAPFSA